MEYEIMTHDETEDNLGDSRDWLTTGQAATVLRLAPGTLQNWRSMGTGPKFIKRGHSVFYTKESIAAYRRSISTLYGSTAEWKENRKA